MELWLMEEETMEKIVILAMTARVYLHQGKFDGYTETLNKLWAEIDKYMLEGEHEPL